MSIVRLKFSSNPANYLRNRMLTESNLMIVLSLSNSLFFSISARDLKYITI